MAAAGAQPADGSDAQPTKSLADLIKELVAESSQQNGLVPDLLRDLLRDLGIALLIAVVVTVVIERYASDRLSQHLAVDVLSAAFGKVIPERIYSQVGDNVFRSDVYRRNWEVHINAELHPVKSGIPIINVSYFYELENLNGHRISYPIPGVIDLDVPLPDLDIPKFKLIEIYDKDNQQLIQKDHTDALLAKQNELTHKEGNLTFTRNTQEMRFAAQVPISPRGKVAVKYDVERAIRVPGDYVLHAPVPADGIKIILTVDGFKLRVLPLHPNRDGLRPTQGDTLLFDAGILPWQGFRFTSEVLPNPRETA